LEDIRTRLGEEIARSFRWSGNSPLNGHLFSLLLFSKKPLGLQEMADQLGVTKAAVSIRIRALERMGLCVKVPRVGDRRDYYQLAENAGLVSIRISLAALRQISSFLENILANFPTDYPEEQRETFETAKRRLIEMKALHDLVLERLDGLDEEWERRKKSLWGG
jgi:DNA-binding transcriptional regulator GbsR (MarR family)